MTENQRKALQAAEDAFRRYADHHARKGDETKARANMALAGQMSAALAQGEDWQLTEAEVGNLWHQHLTKLPHEASAAEFIAGVRAGASAVRQKAGLA